MSFTLCRRWRRFGMLMPTPKSPGSSIRNGPLLRGNRDIDHVHIFPRGEFRGFGAPARLLPWIRETRRLRPDVALDFQGLFRSALIARISGAKKIFGMSDAREGSRFFYTQVARVDRQEHAVDRNFKWAEAFGAALGQDVRVP